MQLLNVAHVPLQVDPSAHGGFQGAAAQAADPGADDQTTSDQSRCKSTHCCCCFFSKRIRPHQQQKNRFLLSRTQISNSSVTTEIPMTNTGREWT